MKKLVILILAIILITLPVTFIYANEQTVPEFEEPMEPAEPEEPEVPDNVDHLEIVSAPSFTCIENYNGYVENTGNGEYFHYSLYPYDVVVRIVYNDGTSITANVYSKIDGEIIYYHDNQYNEPWHVGTDNKMYVTYLGHEAEIPVTVVENPVDHLELVTGTSLTCFENQDNIYPADVVIKIVYKNGTSVNTSLNGDVEGYGFTWYQYEESWHIGTDNNLCIEYLGHKVLLPVTVIENPVDHLELVTGTSFVYVENYEGYDNGEYFCYYTHYPEDAVVKIVYKNGTSVNANVGEGADGYGFGCVDNQNEEPWHVGTDNKLYITYLGHRVELPITVIENPVDHLEIVTGTSHTYIENCNGYMENNGETEFFCYDMYWPDDAVIRIVYTDGTSIEVHVGDEADGFIVDWYDKQYNEPWHVGTDNKLYITYLGHEVELPITVMEDIVDHLEIVTGTSLKYIENINGYIVNNGDMEFFCYDTYCPEDVVIRVVYTDGTSIEVHVGDEVDGFFIESYDNQYEEPWHVGTDNKLYITYLGHKVELPITVIENPVDHLEIATGTSIKYILYAPMYAPIDAEVRIVYKDGTSYTANPGSEVDGHYIDWYAWKSDEEPWHVGTDNKLYITYLGHEVELPITVIEDPVDHLEIVTGTSLKYIENINGHMENNGGTEFFRYATYCPEDAVIRVVYTDGTSIDANVGDEVDGFFIESYHNQYNEPWHVGTDNKMYISYLGHEVELPITVIENPVDHLETVTDNPYEIADGSNLYSAICRAKIKIVYKDGTSIIATVGSEVDGYLVDWWDNQYEEPWHIGTGNILYIYYLGHELVLPITVIENPVDYIEINTAPTREYVLNDEFSFVLDDGDSRYYILCPFDFTGLSFTVHNNDGSSWTMTFGEGDEMPDDFEVYPIYDAVIGENIVTIIYMEHEATYNVILKDRTPGDVNGDGELNAADSVYMLKNMLSGDEAYPLFAENDVNDDGVFDVEDALYLIKHLLNGKLYPLGKKEQF